MNILIEGWRGINHSYALVNQWQIKELIKLSNLSFKDIPYFNENWSSKKNDSGLKDEVKNIVNGIQPPLKNIKYDVTYRISAPFNFVFGMYKSTPIFSLSGIKKPNRSFI